MLLPFPPLFFLSNFNPHLMLLQKKYFSLARVCTVPMNYSNMANRAFTCQRNIPVIISSNIERVKNKVKGTGRKPNKTQEISKFQREREGGKSKRRRLGGPFQSSCPFLFILFMVSSTFLEEPHFLLLFSLGVLGICVCSAPFCIFFISVSLGYVCISSLSSALTWLDMWSEMQQ